MKLLKREDLLKRETLQIVKVDLGNDEYVCVREMTGRERDAFEQSLLKEITDNDGKVIDYKRSTEDFRAKLVVGVICDDEGNALLKLEDYPILSKNMGVKKLDKIVEAAQKLNKISEKDKKDLLKNSDAAQGGNSSLDSVENLK